MTVFESVKEYYGKILQTQDDLKTSACCVAKSQLTPSLKAALQNVPDEVMIKFYGCGSPLPMGISGLTVLDLGSGSGRDCYVCAQLVGPEGRVIGVDMTQEQLAVAIRNVEVLEKSIGWKPQLEFKMGYIEDLEGVPKGSVDLVISNCVVNLSPRKDLVLRSVWNIMKEGGEFYFSDVFADRRVPQAARDNEVLWGECISGALYVGDFEDIAHSVGFKDIRVVSTAEISIQPEFTEILGNAKFSSITYRLFKLPSLESRCEDYGQAAYYKGTIPENKFGYSLDEGHFFETNKPVLVCGNTASMLSETYLKPHFTIVGDRSTHFGLFDCAGPVASTGKTSAQSSSSCC